MKLAPQWRETEWQSPAGLPRWPCWRRSKDGRSCVVSGRHLTPARKRIAELLARWSTLALLILPGWHCWKFRNIPEPLRLAVNAGALKLGFCPLTLEHRNGVYLCMWIGCWLLWPLWTWLIHFVYGAILVRRTTIRFTAREITHYRFGIRRRYDRTAVPSITFTVIPHPALGRLEFDARRRGAERFVVDLQNARFLYLQYHLELKLISSFVTPAAAQQFAAVCQFANDYPLKAEISAPAAACTARQPEVQNLPDV